MNLIQSEQDPLNWDVTWEQATIFRFEQAGICYENGNRNRKLFCEYRRSTIYLSLRGRCFGPCPSQSLHPIFTINRRRQDDSNTTRGKSFVTNNKKITLESQQYIDCTLHSNNFDNNVGKCCGHSVFQLLQIFFSGQHLQVPFADLFRWSLFDSRVLPA